MTTCVAFSPTRTLGACVFPWAIVGNTDAFGTTEPDAVRPQLCVDDTVGLRSDAGRAGRAVRVDDVAQYLGLDLGTADSAPAWAEFACGEAPQRRRGSHPTRPLGGATIESVSAASEK
ncbi:hypothetical protein [Streptomyces sp. IBSNAI001]|uniref:hypothetical protein n=1 Tax=Streptomyces sp. IBSNAI001 TaxID=3457499 RepID=UPI003FCFDEBF